MDSSDSLGIVYVLSNSAMPGLVKIGKTSRESVHQRLKKLYSTGVPVPFECEFAGRVKDEKKIERALHTAFSPYRLPKREFFEIEPWQAIAVLEQIVEEDVTPSLQREADAIDPESADAVQQLKARRPRLNFVEMGVPIGSVLEFAESQDKTVEVVSERTVLFEGEERSLSAVTKELLEITYNVPPTRYWYFNGRYLRDIYRETYGNAD